MASDHDIPDIEARVRKALDAGNYAEASKLRSDALMIMRKGMSLVSQELGMRSS